MFLKIKRDTLLKPLLLTTGFVDRKQTMPILANVYIKKVGPEMIIISNDMEIQASIMVVGDIVGEDFIITLPAKKLQDILKVLSDNVELTFEYKDTLVLIKSGKTQFTLHSLPADHYPLLQISETSKCKITLEQKLLKSLISQIQYAMADKDSRVFLNGMFFEIKDGYLNLVTTDAHRLGFVNIQLNEPVEPCNAIIPRKTILELLKLLDDTDESITITFYTYQVAFETKNKQLITKIIDGKYPEYNRVVPLENDKLSLIQRDILLKALDKVAVIGIDKLKTVTFEIAQNKLTLTCHNEDNEASQDEIDVVYSNDNPLKISFNINYVRDLLINTFATNIQFAFFDHQRSVLVTIPNNNTFKSVLMPLRT